MVEAFGAEVWYYDAPPRRVSTANTLDTPGRRGIYVGRSNQVSGGHKIVPIHCQWPSPRPRQGNSPMDS